MFVVDRPKALVVGNRALERRRCQGGQHCHHPWQARKGIACGANCPAHRHLTHPRVKAVDTGCRSVPMATTYESTQTACTASTLWLA